ncbi:MAG TPA: phosphoribosylamine--glycine ligase [Longimicrobiales bacterium]|nr:phosphoribosylamine--glycine ligase [Longimicrobiales bacterium]
MKILIVGNGGREHALLWKLRLDAPDAEFWITRGNGGTGGLARKLPLDPTDAPAIAAWAADRSADLVVVGPEGPLAAGLADALEARGVAAFGPTAAAARIESSKAYAKRLLRRAGVPTARHVTVGALEDALAHIREHGAPIVVKASGLAAGKGAVVCETVAEAEQAARAMLAEHAFGEAGTEVVLEEFMEGEELSVFALADGERALAMLPAQDHKRIGEGDTGPNTGGMGAYAPVSLATDALRRRVDEEILAPTIAALADDGAPFRGLLYAGLMLTPEGPKVVEFNCRFGDPETQVVLPLLSGQLLEPMLEVARGGSLAGHELAWRPDSALTTVLASRGYPASSEKGVPISIPAEPAKIVGSEDGAEGGHDGSDARALILFHAGTRVDDGVLVTAGGRVLAVTAVAPTLAEAARRSRAAAERIAFDGKQYRADIGWRELARQAEAGRVEAGTAGHGEAEAAHAARAAEPPASS